MALIKLILVYFRSTFKFSNQTVYDFSEIFVEFSSANLGCNYEFN